MMTFVLGGLLITNQSLKLDQDIFIPEGLMGVTNLDKQSAQFKLILTDDA